MELDKISIRRKVCSKLENIRFLSKFFTILILIFIAQVRTLLVVSIINCWLESDN